MKNFTLSGPLFNTNDGFFKKKIIICTQTSCLFVVVVAVVLPSARLCERVYVMCVKRATMWMMKNNLLRSGGAVLACVLLLPVPSLCGGAQLWLVNKFPTNNGRRRMVRARMANKFLHYIFSFNKCAHKTRIIARRSAHTNG